MPEMSPERAEREVDPREVELLVSFRHSALGWVCNRCGALTVDEGDAQVHEDWHDELDADQR